MSYAGGSYILAKSTSRNGSNTTTEAEIVVANETAEELIWLKRFISRKLGERNWQKSLVVVWPQFVTAKDPEPQKVFGYIASSKQKCNIYRSSYKPGVLQCFSDADFGGCMQTDRSTSWLSQRQAKVVTSTTEAEIVAANEAATELIWLKRLISGVSFLKEIPTIYVDNSAASQASES
ncbi:hypothetical protein AVEN_32977-1 [Araneus ventricosus]|uniref:Retrovirus-related Pol polyprotein from transposon TNT 1-94 n=1 Tax=Araneus ventricosus TaxID=182803 RepID=A0A4Y2INI3_ARAVE|nr:hypothetical protein AVEN_32977-1 [Araneus ventricosus]